MTSPIPAYRRLEPPSTRMHKISLAPVLSATLSRDSCCITSTPAYATPAIVAAWRGGVRGASPGGYLAFSRISVTRQRLVADSGRVSISRTRSPLPQAFSASWALYFLVRRITLAYLGCFTRSSTSTTTVLSILSLMTRPSRILRYPRANPPSSAAGTVLASLTVFLHLVGQGHDAKLALPLHRVDARDLLAHGAQPPMALQLTGGSLEPEVEQLELGLGQPAVELILGRGPQIDGGQALSHHASTPSRVTNFALASRASGACPSTSGLSPLAGDELCLSQQSIGSLSFHITPQPPRGSQTCISSAACAWPGGGPPVPPAPTSRTART